MMMAWVEKTKRPEVTIITTVIATITITLTIMHVIIIEIIIIHYGDAIFSPPGQVLCGIREGSILDYLSTIGRFRWYTNKRRYIHNRTPLHKICKAIPFRAGN
eukprot:GHVU01188794.1.p3 GENE.GHVU01188794.1~~GHVU01188794.1.p3  ORF type:complete len:103 (-),score=7.91 GHVU01188794.1:414-722(-)